MTQKRGEHVPNGDPCTKKGCGLPRRLHRIEHKAQYDPCEKCGLPANQHRIRSNRERTGQLTDAERTVFIGIDGEGQGRKEHNYVLLAASTENGDREWVVTPQPGMDRLTTEQCLDMLLELPTTRNKIFSYSFNYDITKMLTDLDNKSLYDLFRPELPHRKRTGEGAKSGPYPVIWAGRNGRIYRLNLQGTKFVVQSNKKRVVIWDLFKFFQAKFVNAIKDWKVGNEALWKRMAHMKDKRADFDKENPADVQAYCLEETRCIAELAHSLVDAHKNAGLTLRAFYGAGSSGAAMLTAMGIKEKLAPTPPEMGVAVATAFFGGRFENSVIGALHEPLQGWDISSAYVYQLAFLPCLEHGSWTHTTKRKDLEKAQSQAGALIRYTLGPKPKFGFESWGPFPFRTRDGSICFPIESGGGWVWLDEYLAGERIFPNVQFQEAWVYSCNCDCKPFGQIPEYYNLRLRIGKEGPGIVIKLGMNSCYGKLAQSVGNAVFNSWIWAGMITSGCRAQILHMMGMHKDMSNLLMVATDGILTREILKPPAPLPTGTSGLVADKKKDGTIQMISKPLGGWEHKPSDKGMFIARPGIYFPLNPTEDEIASIRARGVGRGVVLESWRKIIDAWETNGVNGTATVANVSRFCGGKTSISVSRNGTRYKRAAGKGSRPAYGQWISRKVELSFNPMPKRDRVYEDGLSLELRKFPLDQTSRPYDRATMMHAKEAMELQAAKQELMEQPDGDLTEYESDENHQT